MRSLAAFAVLAALAGSSFAQAPARVTTSAASGERHDIQAVIAAQIAAFQANDGSRALTYASLALQAKFEDGPHFIDMVRTAYPAVFRPSAYSFTALVHEFGQTLQKVELVGPDGGRVLAVYEMIREGDGRWHIAGCTLARSEQIDL